VCMAWVSGGLSHSERLQVSHGFSYFKRQAETNLSSHHCKSHTRPHQCSACCARFANKRHLNRHVNECHTHAEKYYCPVATCKRSKASGKMLPFLREDNCQKHMKTHRLRGLQLKWCDMDESTKIARLQRKIERQTGS
jgi:hypothetical protein